MIIDKTSRILIENFGIDVEDSVYELFEDKTFGGNKLYAYANIPNHDDENLDSSRHIIFVTTLNGQILKNKHPWGERYSRMMKKNIEDVIMMENL